jgi:hypothetical protein
MPNVQSAGANAMTHEEQIERLEQARRDLDGIEVIAKCSVCAGTGVFAYWVSSGKVRYPCTYCAGTGNESRLVEEE